MCYPPLHIVCPFSPQVILKVLVLIIYAARIGIGEVCSVPETVYRMTSKLSALHIVEDVVQLL